MNHIRHLLLVDTEFVSNKKGGQPFQVGFIEFERQEGKYVRVGDFNLHIKLKKGMKLNYYARLCTGMDEVTLDQLGLPFEYARYEVMNYLSKFSLSDTVIVGWDPQGDRRMMNYLLNDKEEWFDVNRFVWHDAMKVYKKYYTELTGTNPSLQSACEKFNVLDEAAHDALNDAECTAKIFFKMVDDLGEAVALPNLEEELVTA